MTKTLQQLAEITGAQLQGPPDMVLKGVGSLGSAGPDQISFVADAKHGDGLRSTRAGAVIIPPDFTTGKPHLVSKHPYLAFAKVMELFTPAIPMPVPGIHPLALVHPEAVVEEGAAVGPFCVVGKSARVGRGTALVARVFIGEETVVGGDCIVYPGVVVRERIRIGHHVIIHPNAVIGADGFAFLPVNGRYEKIPQIGTVVIEDDVEIGANTTIDRAALDATVIGRGTKLDNLVMIAHNVIVGPDTAMAAQVGVSGSTRIGSHVTIGGQAGLAGHIQVGDNAICGAQAGVTKSVEVGAFVSGYPARPHKEAMRHLAEITHLTDTRKKIEALEKRLCQLEQRQEKFAMDVLRSVPMSRPAPEGAVNDFQGLS